VQHSSGRIVSSWMLFGCCALTSCAATPKSDVAGQPPRAEPAAAQPSAAQAAQAPMIAELELKNPSTFARPQTPVYLTFYELGLEDADLRTKKLALVHGQTTVPSHAIDYDGNGQKDGLLALVDLQSAETKVLTVVEDEKRAAEPTPKLTQAEIAVKEGGQWQPRKDKPTMKEYVGGAFKNVTAFTPPPEHTDHSLLIRYEGPGIESDKVGYRMYLDERNGFDIFGKKVATPALQRVGLDGYESYHHMADWGMDILKVGQSLGTGGFGFYDGKKIQLVSDVDGWDVAITENGNLYSSFQTKYRGWKVDGKKVDLNAHFAMVAGSRAVHTRLRASEPLKNMVIGVVKHPETELIQGPTNVTGTAYTYLASWGKQSLNKDMLGMAVLFQRGSLETRPEDAANYAAVVKPEGNDVEYYFLAAWEGEPGGIKTRQDFVAYLDREVERLTLTPRRRLLTAASKQSQVFPLTADSALGWARKLADSELSRKALSYRQGGWDPNRKRKPKFEYDIVGLQPLAYDELAKVTGDPRYAQVLAAVTGSYVTPTGEILEYKLDEYNIDAINPGRNVVRLYQTTKEEKYKKAAALLRKQLATHPRTSEGAFWHKKKYPSQLWLDGVYMGMPFLASYAVTFDNGKGLDDVVKEFVITRNRLRHPDTGLYVHAWDESKKESWADPKTGQSKYYWGRGLGWFSMAAVDVLDFIPAEDQARRKPILAIIEELAPALAKYQDPATGTWWQILDQPNAPGNYRESTASAMFTYFFAKAVRKGYLAPTYKENAQKGFEGMVREFINANPDGKVSMTNQCLVAGLGYGRDGSYRYYMSEPIAENDPKGNGPFILAGVELYQLLKPAG
jgi:unsaturated rhamnogalacturonyl hydrolase